MSDFFSTFKSQLQSLDTKCTGNKVMDTFTAKTGLPRSYGILGTFVFYLFLIFTNVGGVGQILTNFIGFVIPTYYSLVALKTSTTQDDHDLLIYWVVFGFLSVIEFWSKTILYWIPFYFFFKTAFLIYVAVPQFGGAKLIYNNLIDPLTSKYIKIAEPIPNESVSSEINEKIDEVASSTKTSGFSRHH
ncbi:Yop1p SCDLUD_000130 [Saccharomycodes ludwigii]|uniref:Yop1p n=1 Tax=Saccharomycodes ludwigii TaxID=36035 RepID=UPI001E88B5A7|nr:hypothetical protein SCDLUD_000130 [Saccharomycodes ludwigii]KAH3902551.1 hypothetical protein SCDLUD_000130 [Saccharomycodes ludwigii]